MSKLLLRVFWWSSTNAVVETPAGECKGKGGTTCFYCGKEGHFVVKVGEPENVGTVQPQERATKGPTGKIEDRPIVFSVTQVRTCGLSTAKPVISVTITSYVLVDSGSPSMIG